jgi:signal transduction histidine kinase
MEGVAQYDRSGQLQAANASARRIVPEAGLAALEACSCQEDGTPWAPGAHPVTQALKMAQACAGLVMGIRKGDGTLIWISLNATPLLYPPREPWGVVVSLRDVTMQRQTQRRNELVADLLQMAHWAEKVDALAVAMADRLALWARCALVTIRFQDGPLACAYHSRSQAAWPPKEGWASLARLFLGLGDGHPASLTFLDPLPGVFDALPMAAMEEVAGITANIFAKALAEKALRERADALARSRGQLAQAQALAGLGSWSLDLATLEQVWSPETYLQWDCDPAMPAPPFEVLLQKVHPEDREAFQGFHERLRTTRYTEEQEFRILSPSGTVRHLFLQAIPLAEPPGQFQGASMDITTRKLSELALRDVAILSAKGQMAAYIAHEINNPLAGIRNAFLLLEGAIPTSHPHRAYVPMITREIDRIGSIIRTMYHLYRPDPGSTRKMVLREVFYDLESLLAPKCRGQGATIAFDHAGVREEGALNEGFFRQVLFNLIQNALEASPPGGVVTVEARSAGGWIETAVGDTGPGIPPEHAERIFHPGFTTKLDTEMSGLGLGLATCRSLVETMGGTLAFGERRPGPGTVFTVRLPFGLPGPPAFII